MRERGKTAWTEENEGHVTVEEEIMVNQPQTKEF